MQRLAKNLAANRKANATTYKHPHTHTHTPRAPISMWGSCTTHHKITEKENVHVLARNKKAYIYINIYFP
jgi:hypothetical protein